MIYIFSYIKHPYMTIDCHCH